MRKLIHVTQEDIDGAIGGPVDCPVARALSRELGISAVVASTFWIEDGEKIPLSKTVQKFIDAFDGGLPLKPKNMYVEVPGANV